MLEEKTESVEHYEPDMLEMLYERRENHLKGNSPSYSVKEAIDLIKKQHKSSPEID